MCRTSHKLHDYLCHVNSVHQLYNFIKLLNTTTTPPTTSQRLADNRSTTTPLLATARNNISRFQLHHKINNNNPLTTTRSANKQLPRVKFGVIMTSRCSCYGSEWRCSKEQPQQQRHHEHNFNIIETVKEIRKWMALCTAQPFCVGMQRHWCHWKTVAIATVAWLK